MGHNYPQGARLPLQWVLRKSPLTVTYRVYTTSIAGVVVSHAVYIHVRRQVTVPRILPLSPLNVSIVGHKLTTGTGMTLSTAAQAASVRNSAPRA